jgi:hypothetical protein
MQICDSKFPLIFEVGVLFKMFPAIGPFTKNLGHAPNWAQIWSLPVSMKRILTPLASRYLSSMAFTGAVAKIVALRYRE